MYSENRKRARAEQRKEWVGDAVLTASLRLVVVRIFPKVSISVYTMVVNYLARNVVLTEFAKTIKHALVQHANEVEVYFNDLFEQGHIDKLAALAFELLVFDAELYGALKDYADAQNDQRRMELRDKIQQHCKLR
jgi:dsRNA-specific ribonuclease